MTNDDDDYEDDEMPEGVDHDDEWATVKCRYCRAEIAEDSEQCPRCGNWFSREEHPSESKTWFWWVMIVLALAATLACVM
ncbi:hypothetical protein BH11PLA2_BH11PLA2_00710 [soil metagenome]